jgi:hypothetical protein
MGRRSKKEVCKCVNAHIPLGLIVGLKGVVLPEERDIQYHNHNQTLMKQGEEIEHTQSERERKERK